MPRLWRWFLILSFSPVFMLRAEAKSKNLTLAYTAPASQSQQLRVYKPTLRSSTTAFGFEGGLDFGRTSVKVDGNDAGSPSERQSIAGGVFADFGLSRHFALSTELLYLPKGMNSGDTEYSFKYLEVPLLMKVKFGSESFRPMVFFGPSLGVPLSRKIKTATEEKDMDGGGSMDISANVGLGAEVDLSSTKDIGLVFSGRYIHGFIDQTGDPSQNVFNRTILLMTGLRFGF